MEKDYSYLYENQKLACKNAGWPLFAPKQCFHNVAWLNKNKNIEELPTEFGACLVHYFNGDVQKAEKESMQPQTGCRVCHKSWCD